MTKKTEDRRQESEERSKKGSKYYITFNNAVVEGCALPTLISELSRAEDAPRETFETYLRQICAELDQKMPSGNGLEPEDRTLATLALCIGGLSLARAVQNPELSDRILLACRQLAA